MKIVKHLKDDIKGYKKQKKNLTKEIKEDKDLVKAVSKVGKTKRASRVMTAQKAKDKCEKIGKGMCVSKSKEKSMQKKPGGSNVGKYKDVSKKDFAGPSGDAPAGSYPIPTLSKAKSALKLAHNAPNPAGIKKKVLSKFPQLKKKS